MERTNYSTGTVWEKTVGYSRAVKVGNIIEVSGTVATNEQGVVGKGDAAAQTEFILRKIETALIQAGSSLKDVVRTRVYVTNIDAHWEAIGKVHGTFFQSIRPASAMVEVSKLIHPDYLVEIEATAIVQ